MGYNIDKFVNLFVHRRWRSRFKHEFAKMPHDLMHRCIISWERIFFNFVLHDHKPIGFRTEIVKVIDWGDIIEEWGWTDFLEDYPKAHYGFIAIAKSGKLGFLETHEDHPKHSRHYYIYKSNKRQ